MFTPGDYYQLPDSNHNWKFLKFRDDRCAVFGHWLSMHGDWELTIIEPKDFATLSVAGNIIEVTEREAN